MQRISRGVFWRGLNEPHLATWITSASSHRMKSLYLAAFTQTHQRSSTLSHLEAFSSFFPSRISITAKGKFTMTGHKWGYGEEDGKLTFIRLCYQVSIVVFRVIQVCRLFTL